MAAEHSQVAKEVSSSVFSVRASTDNNNATAVSNNNTVGAKPDNITVKHEIDTAKPDNDKAKPDNDKAKPDNDKVKPDNKAKPDNDMGKPDNKAKPDNDKAKPDNDTAKPDNDMAKTDNNKAKPDKAKPDNEQAKPDNNTNAAKANNDTENIFTMFQDLKVADNMKISDSEWEVLSETPAVKSCMEIFDEKKKVVAALQHIKMKHGELPADITGNMIAEIILELEDGIGAYSPRISAKVDIFDQGHQEDGTHEVQVAYKCEKCESKGMKPTFKMF